MQTECLDRSRLRRKPRHPNSIDMVSWNVDSPCLAEDNIRWQRSAPVRKEEEPLTIDRCVSPSSVSEQLEAAVSRARAMLDLPDNWDDEGAVRIDHRTWDRAVGFLRRTVTTLVQERCRPVAVPAIQPVGDGSIDLHWRTATFELLLNIPSPEREIGGFYGETTSGLTIKGKFRPELHDQGILSWLVTNG
jgi:hypothetical protein